VVIVRATDTPTYVQYGAADLGVAGKDILLEHGSEGLYQPIDLKIAKCRMMVAAPAGFDYAYAVRQGARLKVATKYVNIAREHFAAKGVHVDLIKLYGSMELAPLAGLADAIVDLVSTGSTLKANNLLACRAHHGHLVAIDRQSGRAQTETRAAGTDSRRHCRRGRPMIAIKRLSSTDADFNERLDALLAFEAAQDACVEQTVADILSDVKARGDAAVIEYTRRFDALSAHSMAELERSQSELQQALAGCRRCKGRRSKPLPSGCAATTSDSRYRAGNTKTRARKRAARCWVRR
jgi:ATP phosphoribosyltransferase